MCPISRTVDIIINILPYRVLRDHSGSMYLAYIELQRLIDAKRSPTMFSV